jgi:hypothetical protein
MSRALPILILFFLLMSAVVYPQVIMKDDRLRGIIKEYGQADVSVPYTTRKEADILSRNLSIYSLRDRKLFITISPGDVDWFLEQKIDYQIIENKGTKGLVAARDIDQAMEWDTYPTYTQYDSIMRKFTSLYPSLCKLDTIGFSVNNRLVLVLKISDNIAIKENKPKVFYTSSMHGDETGGFVLMLRLIDYLLKNYNTSTQIRELVDNLEIWVNPLANPDGTYRSGNVISNPVRNNATGYNLNRSFPDPMDPSIVVPKENIDMIKFLREHRFVISANFHSGAEVVNYPWDFWGSKYHSNYHADESWFLSVSRAYADTVHKYSGTGYMTDLSDGVTRGYDWYSINGGRQDFVTWELQGREVTIELDSNKITPAAQLGLLWSNNRSSLLGYLENALHGIHGIVRDSATLAPVRAKVFIAGHDKDSSHVYSDSTYGAFVRMLYPGTYNLTFSAEGHKSKTVNNVDVSAFQRTDLQVDLGADLTKLEVPESGPPKLYPVPASGTVYALLPENLAGEINVQIISYSGKLISEYKSFSQKGVAVILDVHLLPSGNYIIQFRNILTGSISKGKLIVVKKQ